MPNDASPGAQDVLRAFSEPHAVARYTDGPPRFLPGLDALHRMTGILLADPSHGGGRLSAIS
jgi:tRNA (cmo5U34)-methyltransferase